jgi:hypothetical protein
MASKNLIIFYKGIVLKKLHEKVIEKIYVEIDDLDKWIKINNDIDKSTKDMSNIELINICRWCFEFGDDLGIYLNFPNNEFP